MLSLVIRPEPLACSPVVCSLTFLSFCVFWELDNRSAFLNDRVALNSGDSGAALSMSAFGLNPVRSRYLLIQAFR